ncbi:MAG TPA: YihY/virulence factor BrkB family protein [Phycisphaerales bacterium]|nr:YihY/virulence factor BrkB family protein [Phycisphaerales bacterium]
MIDLQDIQQALSAGFIARLKVLGKVAGQRYRRSQITQMAAALSFRSIFGLIPMLAVGLVVLHSFVNEAQMRRVISTTLDYTGLANISVDTSRPGAEVGAGAGEYEEIFLFGPPSPAQQVAAAEQAKQAEAVKKERLDEWITKFLNRVGSVNFGAVGIVGLVLLIYAALTIIVEAEKSFNQIIEAATGKNWVRRIRDYWALLTLGPLLLVMSFGVRQGAKSLAESWTRSAEAAEVVEGQSVATEVGALAEAATSEVAEIVTPPADVPAEVIAAHTPEAPQQDIDTGWRGALVGLVGFVATVMITTLALVIVYTSVPNASVQVIAACAGAAFAALLWEASKWAFTSYIEYSTTYARLYGVMALIPLFLLWIYVTWIIVLLGFQVTAILQRYRQVSREGFKESVLIALGIIEDPEDAKGNGLRLVDPASVLLVMAVVTDYFVRGLPADARAIADQTGLDAPVVNDLLGRLVDIALLHRVAVKADAKLHTKFALVADASVGERYTLARPPDAIAASEVLRVGDSFTSRDASRPAPILDAMREAKMRALEGKSLADIHAMLARRETPVLV